MAFRYHLLELKRASLRESQNPTEMDRLKRVVRLLDELLSRHRPQAFSSAWILEHAPSCYRFIRKHIRSEVGRIDWDKITCALEPKHQRLWAPRLKKSSKPYIDRNEVSLVLNKYRSKLYVFLAPADDDDFRIRDMIAIALVRIAQVGNSLAKAELVKLIRYTVDEWLDNYDYMSRWRGRDHDIRVQLEGCIRRYRYSGSFLRYVFWTLHYAGREIRPLCTYSLDDPVGTNRTKHEIDNVTRSPQTNEIVCLRSKWVSRRLWRADWDQRLGPTRG